MNETSERPELISRADAKAQGRGTYFTGKPCPNGHVATRRVSNFNCTKCLHRKQQKKRKAILLAELAKT